MIKRFFDILFASTALCIFVLPLVVCALAVWIDIGSPVFFKQKRIGRNGRVFDILKLRTMGGESDLDDESRISKTGRIMRDLSLDELPQLLNVLRGEMSVVGPRPLLEEYKELYTPRQMRRHTVRPGMTGWAQINGRNSISWDERFNLDIWYVENQTFGLDCKILWITIQKVFFRKSLSSTENRIF